MRLLRAHHRTAGSPRLRRPEFHQQVIKLALKGDAALISVQDALFIPKSGKQTFGLDYCFNGCHARLERGLEISNLAVVDVTRRCAFKLAVAQTPPAPAQASKQLEDETLLAF